MPKYYKIGMAKFNQIYERYLAGIVFHKPDPSGYIIKTYNKRAMSILDAHGIALPDYIED